MRAACSELSTHNSELITNHNFTYKLLFMKKIKPFLPKTANAKKRVSKKKPVTPAVTNADAYPNNVHVPLPDVYLDRQDILQIFHICPRTLSRWRDESLIHFTK